MIMKKPKYSYFEEQQMFLSANTKIITDIPWIKEQINKKITVEYPENVSFKSLIFCAGTPDRIKRKIKEIFGIEYSDKCDTYTVEIGDDITVYSKSGRGLIYGAISLFELMDENYINRGIYYEAPVIDIRGAKVYLPGPGNIAYFKEFIDFLSAFRMNTLMIEIGGAMEYKKHPEINDGWAEYCKLMYEYSGKSEEIQEKTYKWKKNSIHSENGEGGFLTQEQIKEIIEYCNDRHIEIIPEVPSFSHCDYLLTRHPEIRERQDDDYADTYCPSNEGSYELLFDVLDEIIELFKPKEINIGHDEAYSIGKCEKCKNKDPVKIYCDDIIKIRDYLSDKNIKTMMWGEKLLDARIFPGGHPCGGAHIKYDWDGKTLLGEEEIPPIYPCADLLPKDICMFHWYWSLCDGYDEEYHKRGFSVIYGNYDPINFREKNWRRRMEHGVRGAVISNWSTVKKENLQRNNILYKLAYANLLFWEDDYASDLDPGFEKAAFELLYKYNYANVKHGFRILHTTDLDLEYRLFYDGYFIVHEDYDLGYYNIKYTDGTNLKIPVEYGMNISSSKNKWDMSEHKLPEVASTTIPVYINSGDGCFMAYEFIFETGYDSLKPVKSIEYVPNPNIAANVAILKFEAF